MLSDKRIDKKTPPLAAASLIFLAEALTLAKGLLEIKFFLPRMEMLRRLAATCAPNHGDMLITGEGASFKTDPYPFIRRDGQCVYQWDIQFGTSRTFVYANLHNEMVLHHVIALIDAGVPFVLRPLGSVRSSAAGLLGWGLSGVRWRMFPISRRAFPRLRRRNCQASRNFRGCASQFLRRSFTTRR
jgi:hypothetical protein